MNAIAHMTGAQTVPSAEERQIGVGAPRSLGQVRVSRSGRNEQRRFGGGATTCTARLSGPDPSRRTMERSSLTKVKLLRVTGTYSLATLRRSNLICPHRPQDSGQ